MDPLKTIDLSEAEREQNRRRQMRRYWIFFGSAGVLIIFGLVSLYYRTQDVSATKISDKAFVMQANAVCTKYLPALINKQPQEGETLKNADIVQRVNDTVNGMETIRTKIAAIPVTSVDQAAVTDWLASWQRYIAAGQQYVVALSKSDKAAYQIGDNSTNDSAKITAFAIVNHIDQCELRTQQSTSIM